MLTCLDHQVEGASKRQQGYKSTWVGNNYAGLAKGDASSTEPLAPQTSQIHQNTDPLSHQRRMQATLKTYQQALTTAQAKNNRLHQVNILKRIGIIHCKLGEEAWGIVCLKQALQLAQELGNLLSVGIILNYLGAAYRQTGQEHKALKIYLRALEVFKQIGNEAGVALILNHIGEVYNNLGQLEQALVCSRQALEKLQTLGNSPDGEGLALYNIGDIYLQMKRYRQALVLFEQALAIYQKIGNRKGEAKALEGIATAYVTLDQEQQGLELYQQALELYRNVGDSPHFEARCLDCMGAVFCKMGNPAHAIVYHLKALGILPAYNSTVGIYKYADHTALVTKLLHNLLPIYDRIGMRDQGVKCYQKAVEIVHTFGEKASEEAIFNVFHQENS